MPKFKIPTSTPTTKFTIPKIEASPYEESLIGDIKLDSKYDLGLLPGMDVAQHRAEQQTISDKWGNAVPKFLGTAFTSFAEPFVNMTYGVGSAISNGETDNIYDNTVTRNFDRFNDNISKAFPHYYTEKEKQAEWWKSPMYANFWADKIGNGAGFLLGAIGSGYLTAGTGVFGNVATRGSKILNSVAKLSTTGEILSLAAKGGEALSDINRLAKLAKLRTSADQLGSSFLGAVGESGMEAREVKKDTYDNLISQKRQELERDLTEAEIKEIDDLSDSAGNVAFGLNLAIVGSSNMFQFGSLFKSGYNHERQLLNKLSKNSQGVITPDKVSKLETVGKALATPAEEFIQETSQFAVEKGTKDYYNRKYDNDGKSTVDDIINSTLFGLKKAYGTKEGLEQGLVGAILGGYGIATGIKDSVNKTNNTQKAAAILNKYKLSHSFKPLYDAAIKHVSYEQDKEKALQRGDIFAYKNAEFDQFKSYAKSRIDTDQYERLIDEIEEVKNLSEEEFKNTFGFEQGKPLPKNINQFVDSLKEKANELYNISTDIDTAFPNVNSSIKERIFDAASNLSNIDTREKELSLKLRELTSRTIGSKNVFKFSNLLKFTNPAFQEEIKQSIDFEVSKRSNPKDYRNLIDKEIKDFIKEVNPVAGKQIQEIVEDLFKLSERREEFIIKYNNLTNPKEWEKIIKEDEAREQKEANKKATIEKQAEDKLKTDAANFVSENADKFESLDDLFNALDEVPEIKREIAYKHKSIIDNTLIADKSIPIQEIDGRQAKEIPQKLRVLYGNNSHIDISDKTTFTPVKSDTTKGKDETIDKVDNNQNPDLVSVPVNAIKVPKVTPKELPNIVTTRNTEFEYDTVTINSEKYIVPRLNEAGAIPIENKFDKELFKIDFNLLSNPYTLSNGTIVTLEIMDTIGEFNTESIIVKLNDSIVGKLSLKKDIAKIKKAIRDNNGSIKVKLNGKWGSSAIRTKKTNTSLNDIKTFSPSSLVGGNIIIGTIKEGDVILPDNISDEVRNNLNINNPVNGKHFVVLTTPEGTYYPDMLWSTSIDEIKINDTTISETIISDINKFIEDINKTSISTKQELATAREKWNKFKKEKIQPFTNYSINKFDLGLSIDRNTKKLVVVLNKGTRTSKKYISGEDVVKDIKKRFFDVNYELLQSNEPFTFNNKEYSNYTDFIVDNNILTTSLYPVRPFSFTELDIDISDIEKTKPAETVSIKEPESKILATEEAKETKTIEEDEKKKKLREKLNKNKVGSNNALTRLTNKTDYTLWNKERELEWLSRNLPQIPVEVANSTLDIYEKFGVEAFGVFANSVIHLANNAEVGTSYHEAFHAVFNLYLTESEASKILTDTGRSEEVLAEEFRDYVISNEDIKPSGPIVKFFKDIYLWIKNLFGLKQLNDLFYQISSGNFADSKVKGESIGVKTRLVPGFNAVEQKKRINASMGMLFTELKEFNNNKSILNIETVTIEQLEEALENVKGQWEIAAEEDSRAAKVFNNFDKLKPLIIKEFERLGFKTKDEYQEYLDEESIEQEEQSSSTKERIYDKAAFESSQKETVSREVKLYLATLPKALGPALEGQFEHEHDDLGFVVYNDFHDIYNYLSENLVGAEDIEEMIDRLEDLTTIRPELHEIIYDLKKNPSQESSTDINSRNFRHKFFTTFSNQYIDFLTLSKGSRVYQKTRNGRVYNESRFFFNVYETNKRTLQRQIVNTWYQTYKELQEENQLKRDPSQYEYFRNILDKKFKKQLNDPNNYEGLDEIAKLLDNIGIKISEKALRALKDNYYKTRKVNGLFTSHIRGTDSPTIGAILNSHHVKGIDLYSGIEGEESDTTVFGERKAINELAKFEKLVHVDRANASFLNGQNKTVFAINSNHYASKLTNRLKSNKDNIIEKLSAIPYYKSMKVLRDLKKVKDFPREFRTFVFDTVFDNDSKYEGTSYDELDELQSVATKINMFFNKGSKYGYFHVPTPSDRGNIQVFKLEKLSTENESIFYYGKIDKTSEFYKWLIGSIKDEYSRIVQTHSEWDGKDPIKNYHTNTIKDADGNLINPNSRGNAFYFNQYYKLNDFFKLDDYYDSGAEKLPDFNEHDENLYEFINEMMWDQFSSDRKKLVQSGIITITPEGIIAPKSKETSRLLDDKIRFEDVQGNVLIDNYIANYYYSNTELTKLLSGDTAFYKGSPLSKEGREIQIADLNKRFGQSFVPGRDLSVSTEHYMGGAKDNFTIAIVGDNEIPSEYLIDYARAIYDSLSEKEEVDFSTLFDKNRKEFNATEIYLRSLLKTYTVNNQTDAQGFITLERQKNIMEGQGTFTGKYAEAWFRLKEGRTDINDFNTVFQPNKGFYYNLEFRDGIAIPVQVKYSTVPLIPSFVNKFPSLRKLVDKMEKAKVDELVFSSGIKVGAQKINSINIVEDNVDIIPSITLSNKNWRIPQVVPYKDKIKENFGSQIRKLITGNLSINENYNIPGWKGTGGELKKIYQNIIRQNIKENYDKLVPKFSNIERVSKLLLEQIQGNSTRALPDIYEKALEYIKEAKDTRISLDFPLIKRKVENILLSLFQKQVVKQEMPGFSAVQVSSFCIAKTSFDLKFVRQEGNEIKPAEVLVSPQFFLNYLKKKGFPVTDFVNEQGEFDITKVTEDMRKLVLYRIPTQGKNSMLPAYIKGFLPHESGSTIILPFEVTSQAGSDYDIDKVYVEMYNFAVTDDKKIEKINYIHGQHNHIDARQNALIDIHYSILTDPKHFAELITPNNTNTLKRLKDEIANKFIDDTEKNWHNLWVQEDLRSKNQAGKQLVGVYSIQSTAHSVAQDLEMSLNEPVKFQQHSITSLHDKRNIDGKLISDDLSERQTAAVDNAKEPILGELNDNKFTAPVISLIIRTGYGNAIPSYFVNQPIIRYLTREYRKYSSFNSPAKALKKAIELAEERYGVDVETNTELIEVLNFDLEYLEEHITDNHTNSKGSVHHKNILEAFIKYRDMGESLSRVSNGLSIDTSGVQATIAENLSKLQNLEDAKVNKYITFNKDKYLEHSIHHYEIYGIRAATEHIKKYMPLDSSVLMTGIAPYKGILTRLEKLKGSRLSPDEINKIIYDLYTYIHTHPNSNMSKISNEYKKRLLEGERSLSKKIKAYVKDKSRQELNLFISNLKLESKDPITGFDYVKFNNTGSRTSEEKTTIVDSFLDLYNGSEEETRLAMDLTIYSFITGGFTRTADSYIDYIPLEIYERIGLTDFYKTIKGYFEEPIINGSDVFNTDNFITQYIQNNYKEVTFIDKMSPDDFDALNPTTGPEYVFTYGTNKLYRNNIDKYVQIGKLGVPNHFKEYNMSDAALQSIHESNNIAKKQKSTLSSVPVEIVSNLLEKLSSRFGIEYSIISDEKVDYAGKYENGKVVINIANVGLDTPFHEFAHPFIEVVKKENPVLYKTLEKEIRTTEVGQEIMRKVRMSYSELSTEERMEESIVQAIGEYAANRISTEHKGLLSIIRTLLQRIAGYIKKAFSNTEININELDPRMTLEDIGRLFATSDSKIRGIIPINNLRTKYQVNKTSKTIDSIRDILNRQIAIYSNIAKPKEAVIERLTKLSDSLTTLTEIEGINLFISEALRYTKLAKERIDEVVKDIDDKSKIHDNIAGINEVYQYISSYSILDEIAELPEFKDNYEHVPGSSIHSLHEAIRRRNSIIKDYYKYGVPLLADVLMPYFNTDINDKALAIEREDLIMNREKLIQELTEASRDIGSFSAMLDPAISTNDVTISLFAKLVKSKLEEARKKDIEAEFEFAEAYEKYKKESGLNSNSPEKFNDLIYEIVEKAEYEEIEVEGKKKLEVKFVKKATFIQDYDVTRYEKDKAQMMINTFHLPEETKYASRVNWFKSHPRRSYKNKKWEALQDNKVALEYYNFLTEKYKKSQEKLPETHRRGLYLPSVRKSDKDRGVVGAVKSTFKEGFSYQDTDTQYGIQTQTGEIHKTIPIYYTNSIPIEDVSLDLLSSVMRFSSMTNEYVSKSEIQAEVNLMKDVIAVRETRATNSKGENILDALSKKFGMTNYLKKTGKTNAEDRVNKFIDMVYYGESKEKEEMFGLSADKVADTLMKFTSYINLAGNLISGVSNVTMANIMAYAEGAGGQWYSRTDWAKANGIYFSSVHEVLADIGKIGKKSLLSQMIDVYDALQGSYKNEYGHNVTGNIAKKLFTTDSLFMFNNMGEHQVQVSTMLALMNATKVRDAFGKEMTLYEAHELRNGKLELKPGIVFTDKEQESFKNRLHGINKRLHGVYNEFDKSVIQKKTIGRLAMLHRKWIAPGLRRRFQEIRVDNELEDIVEGNYRTFWRILSRDIRAKRIPILSKWNSLSNMEKQNLRRFLSELVAFTIATAVFAFAAPDDEDEEANTWIANFIALEARRTQTEIGFYFNPLDTYRILRTPTATMGTMEKSARFIDQFLFTWNPDKLLYERRSGVHRKGDNKSWAKFKQLLPIMNKVEDISSPEEGLKFFSK